MLWIAVFLPELSLQSHMRGALGYLHSMPVVICCGSSSSPQVHAANACAYATGIEVNMPIAAARARCAGVVVLTRKIGLEQAALTQVAYWLAQFSPMTCCEAAGVLLEVRTTLRLFGGIDALVRRIRCGLSELGFRVSIGIAPTPLAAQLLAQAADSMPGIRMCHKRDFLAERLAKIPLALFAWPERINRLLGELGFFQIKDLISQPRAGLARRLGNSVLYDLDRALAQAADPRVPISLPEQFASSLEIPFDIADIQPLLVPMKMLLNEMQGFLRARGTAVHGIRIEFKHDKAITSHAFGSRRPLRDAFDWMRLIRERLEVQALSQAVTGINLFAGDMVSWQAKNESLLPHREEHAEKWECLIDRISSRLGKSQIFFVDVCDDCRPECAWTALAAGANGKRSAISSSTRPRPLILLREPCVLIMESGLPQHRGPLELLAGPERIEAGWWDTLSMGRDYFVARNKRNEVCWIFYDYQKSRRWYLHGYFS